MDFNALLNSLTSFEKICELMTETDLNDIIAVVSQAFGGAAFITRLPAGNYVKDKTDRHYCFVLNDLKQNLRHYKWLYHKLADDRSREVFVNLLRYRILPYSCYLRNAFDAEHAQYFDPGIVQCSPDEVFVDCGGFIGDTAESFVQHYPQYKHVYTYEPSSENYIKCAQTVSKYPNITVKPFGVGKKEATVAFAQSGAASSFLIDSGNKENVSGVKITSLDADIAEPVSFIKMDVEGFEIDALIGSKGHIQNDYPKLAICIYHLPSDIWEIPRLIDTLRPDYDYYMRHYNDVQSWETVIYAIPKKPEKPAEPLPRKAQLGVYAINGYFGYWTNQELTKDCGLVPYLFHQKYGCKAVMVGKKTGEYPYLETCVPGLEMDFTPDASIEARCRYVSEHSLDMDVLTLYGPYPQYFSILDAYRKLRPDGKVYLALDANSQWMDKIRCNDPDFLEFMGQCDVIATSCRRMQRLLGIKWPFKIEYIPNAYYNYLGCDMAVDLSAKENVILTVGRIGTRQKNNEMLMEAFAVVSKALPDWTLRIVGRIESAFQSYIDQYFAKHPHLKDRVVFTGMIEDKRELLAEYRKAKVFALTSTCEGGSPNVIAEALFSGCYIITTDIDASDDATNFSRCGKVVPIGDVIALSHMLVHACVNPALLEAGSRNVLDYARREFDFEKIIDRIHYLLFAKEDLA